jgi:hypothetical protein
LLTTELGQKVQGTGDEDRSLGAGQLDRAGTRGNLLGHRFDPVEVR